MKVPLHLVEARRTKLATLLDRHSYLPLGELCRLLGVSEATARRDLRALESERKIIRTFGGALTEFNRRFTSFHERMKQERLEKDRIARCAVEFIQPGMTCYFDTGTTLFALASALAVKPVAPLRIVTNSLPVAERLAPIEGVEVHLPGGQLLVRQSVLLGPAAAKALRFYKFDLALMSAEGVSAEGICNSQDQIVKLQQKVLAAAPVHYFLMNASKLSHTAPHFLTAWDQVQNLISEAPADLLRERGIPLQTTRYIQA